MKPLNSNRKIWQVPGLIQVLTTAIIILMSCSGPLTESGVNLEEGFQNPPEGAKPRVWWHWMNGNISKEGIRADLEWMERTGIGGFQNFDAGLATPQIIEKRLIYMTQGWKFRKEAWEIYRRIIKTKPRGKA